MPMIKCKMCGGTLQINNEIDAVCECCGTQQTLHKLEDERLEDLYNCAKKALSEVNTESGFRETAYIFKSISDYKDSATLAQVCYEKAEIERKNAILADGKYKMTSGDLSDYKLAIKLFEFISGWKDADERIAICKQTIEELNAILITVQRGCTHELISTGTASFTASRMPSSRRYGPTWTIVEPFRSKGKHKALEEKALPFL